MKPKNTYRPTILGFAILGLLQEEARSGYAIRKVFEATALGQYSSSPGSIYPAIRRLEDEGLVVPREPGVRGTPFEITSQGLRALKGWLSQSVEPSEAPLQVQELLLRFVFMEGLVEKPIKVEFLTAFQEGVRVYADQLEAYLESDPEELSLHGRLALRHGIDGYRMDEQWAGWALGELGRE